MAKYVYPAIFKAEVDGGYSISFPDIPSCYTCGDDLADGLDMAEDVLALTIFDLEEKNEEIPIPSPIGSIEVVPDEFTTYISCDTKAYRRRHSTKVPRPRLPSPGLRLAPDASTFADDASACCRPGGI